MTNCKISNNDTVTFNSTQFINIIQSSSEDELISYCNHIDIYESNILFAILKDNKLCDKYQKFISIQKFRNFINFNTNDLLPNLYYPTYERVLNKDDEIVPGFFAKQLLHRRFPDVLISDNIEWWLISKFEQFESDKPNSNGSYTIVSNGYNEFSRKESFTPNKRFFSLNDINNFQPNTWDLLISLKEILYSEALLDNGHFKGLNIESIKEILLGSFEFEKNNILVIPKILFTSNYNIAISIPVKQNIEINGVYYLWAQIIEIDKIYKLYDQKIVINSFINSSHIKYNYYDITKQYFDLLLKESKLKKVEFNKTRNETAKIIYELGLREENTWQKIQKRKKYKNSDEEKQTIIKNIETALKNLNFKDKVFKQRIIKLKNI